MGLDHIGANPISAPMVTAKIIRRYPTWWAVAAVTEVGNDVSDDDETGVTSSGDHITMRFKMGETQVKLELEKNKNVQQLTSYYTAENGRLIQWTLDQKQVKPITNILTFNF